MTKSNFLKTIVAMTSALFALSAASQPADTTNGDATDPAMAATQDATSAKAIRTANRRLTRSIGTALARARGLDSTRIFIRSVSGVVTLSGTVPDASQVMLAITTAQQVTGVRSVKNLLRVDTRGISAN